MDKEQLKILAEKIKNNQATEEEKADFFNAIKELLKDLSSKLQ